MEEQKRNDSLETPRIKQHDEWALEWINVTRLQPIVEAFDDDASNFITVTEANDLTTSRPRDWRCAYHPYACMTSLTIAASLLHWLAYWAIGASHPRSFPIGDHPLSVLDRLAVYSDHLP